MQQGSSPTQETLAQLLAMLRAGKVQEAAPHLQQIVAEYPDNFEALRLSGIAAHLQGKTENAVAFLERALRIEPEAAETHYNLGVMLNGLSRLDEAISSLKRAIELDPDNAEAHDALGSAYLASDRLSDAIASFKRAIEVQPGFAAAHSNLGHACSLAGQLADASIHLRKAVKLDANLLEAQINLGGVLSQLKQYDEAVEVLTRVTASHDFAAAFSNLGTALTSLKRYEDAMAAFQRAVEIDPSHDVAYSQNALIARRVCDWSAFTTTETEITRRVRAANPGISPFVFLTFSDDAEDQLLCARNYTAFKKFHTSKPVTQTASPKDERIKIAYVSADFREHPVAYQIAELIECHDRDRFEVIGISLRHPDDSTIGQRLLNAFDDFVNASTLSHTAVAEEIAGRGIHIAIDLNGYTADARPEIFAMRPAPIQVNYLGYPCTMGAPFIDYIVVDRTIAPASQADCFHEQIVHLPDSYMVTDTRRPISKDGPTRKDAGLPEDGIVFCCFHNSYKITPVMFDIWMRLLDQVPRSVIWLRIDDDLALENLRREAEKRGISPERLVVAPRMEMADHVARHRLADVFLDTLPYNAHSSTSDALLAGLPVLTCTGNAFAGRVAASQLQAIGLPELVTDTLEDYEASALRLARDPDALQKIRETLERNLKEQPLFDCPRFCKHLESAYESMAEQWRAGESPAAISATRSPNRENRY